jgi:hypothetical protein
VEGVIVVVVVVGGGGGGGGAGEGVRGRLTYRHVCLTANLFSSNE